MKNQIIIDVRTKEEFEMGHVPDAINIPLNEIPNKIAEIKSFDEEIILCCASGGRSAQATSYLKRFGLNCTDAGSWTNLMKFNN
ncbi:MAG: rhodanese-like domain-containing protein [Cytophagales bacterium]